MFPCNFFYQQNPSKIVVVGASGYIGTAVVKACAAITGVAVVAVVRDPKADKSQALLQAGANVSLAQGSMADAASSECRC